MNNNKAFVGVVIVMLYLSGCKSEEGEIFSCDSTKPTISTVNVTSASCGASDGSLEIIATGASNLSYKIDNQTEQTSSVFESLNAGTYTITVTDEDACFTTQEVVVGLKESDLASTITVGTDAGCGTSNGIINVTGSGGSGSYEYSIDGITFQSSGIFDGLEAKEYEITTKDASGCIIASLKKVSRGTSYELDVKPIIMTNCAVSTCHNGDNGASKDWTDFSNVQAKASLMKSRTQSGSMPQGSGTITQEEIDIIACWVDDGALDN